MAITVDWINKIVHSTSSITDMVAFHVALRDIEDSEIAMIYPVIHTYKEVDLGGAIFPSLAFINGYTLEFSAGSYEIKGGNLLVTINPIAGVFIKQTQSAAYAVTAIGGSGAATPSQIADSVWSHSTAAQALSDISFIKDIEGGRWKIIANQMIFYKQDNTTEIARFDLKDSSGAATMSNPMERVRA